MKQRRWTMNLHQNGSPNAVQTNKDEGQSSFRVREETQAGTPIHIVEAHIHTGLHCEREASSEIKADSNWSGSTIIYPPPDEDRSRSILAMSSSSISESDGTDPPFSSRRLEDGPPFRKTRYTQTVQPFPRDVRETGRGSRTEINVG
jgi:hypothetical protein